MNIKFSKYFKKKIQPLLHFFFTSKPYSYASELSRGILFCLVLKPNNPEKAIWLAGLLTFLMWLYFNWQSDFIQGDPGRIKPPIWLCLLPLIISSTIGFASGGILGTIGVLLYASTIILYSFKSKVAVLGLIGPLLRSITITGNFFMLALSFAIKPTWISIYFLILLAILIGTRNFIGDVRDMRTDRWEVPARFGDKMSFTITNFAFLFMFLIILFLLNNKIPVLAVFILVFTWIFMIMLYVRFHRDAPHKWGYFAHRLLILTVTFFQIILGSYFGLSSLWIVFIICILVILQPCYSALPGKDFPSWRELFSKYSIT